MGTRPTLANEASREVGELLVSFLERRYHRNWCQPRRHHRGVPSDLRRHHPAQPKLKIGLAPFWTRSHVAEQSSSVLPSTTYQPSAVPHAAAPETGNTSEYVDPSANWSVRKLGLKGFGVRALDGQEQADVGAGN